MYSKVLSSLYLFKLIVYYLFERAHAEGVPENSYGLIRKVESGNSGVRPEPSLIL